MPRFPRGRDDFPATQNTNGIVLKFRLYSLLRSNRPCSEIRHFLERMKLTRKG